MQTVRVLVADDHPIVFDGVTLALQRTSWLQVAGHARSGAETITAVQRFRPDVVLLDLRLPDMLAPEVIAALLAEQPTVKIIIFTAYPDHAALGPALAAGAHGVIVKDTERADLVDVIRRVVAGERVNLTGAGADNLLLLNRKLREHGLTRREYEILRHVAMGEDQPGDRRRVRTDPQHRQDVPAAGAGEAQRPQPGRGPGASQPTGHPLASADRDHSSAKSNRRSRGGSVASNVDYPRVGDDDLGAGATYGVERRRVGG